MGKNASPEAKKSEAKKCCKQCDPEKSIPCGDACIAKDKKCHKGKGCACSSSSKCCKQCDPEKSIPCGDACIPKVRNVIKGKAVLAANTRSSMSYEVHDDFRRPSDVFCTPTSIFARLLRQWETIVTSRATCTANILTNPDL